MAGRFIVALDQGTTSSRAVLVGADGAIAGIAQREFTQHFPQPGWVEHDPAEIWTTQREVLHRLLREHGVRPAELAGIGITNQRETTLLWDRRTGEPIAPAIVWQDRRTAAQCRALREDGREAMIRERTGLVVDPYFSATKIRWLLDHVPDARRRAREGALCFGTVDSWLVWNLTGGAVHATDPSNASRTMLFNLHDLAWDPKLCELLEVPAPLLPEVRDSSGDFGAATIDGVRVPILGVAGDQQAALFGQACFAPGLAKNTYGTGCFLLMHTGERPAESASGLLSTVAWRIGGKTAYALEGSVLVAGAAIQWLRDGLGTLASAAESEALARTARNADEVYFVPAFAGLGTPYWDMDARGAIFGLTRDTGREHLAKAALEAMAFQTRDVLDAMQRDTGLALRALRVDGGASANDFLMQFQADLLDVPVERPASVESTALGAAGLAGLAAGLWDQAALAARRRVERTFQPSMPAERRAGRLARWRKAVERTRGWLRE